MSAADGVGLDSAVPPTLRGTACVLRQLVPRDAPAALRLVTACAWAERPELTRLYAPIFGWNEGSMAVARHAGYVLEARLPRSAIKAGRVIDRVQYAAYRP